MGWYRGDLEGRYPRNRDSRDGEGEVGRRGRALEVALEKPDDIYENPVSRRMLLSCDMIIRLPLEAGWGGVIAALQLCDRRYRIA